MSDFDFDTDMDESDLGDMQSHALHTTSRISGTSAASPLSHHGDRTPALPSAAGRTAFRVNRKAYGLTYSCPVDCERNPIPDCEHLRDFLIDTYGPATFVIAEEMHKNEDGSEHESKNHFHVYIKFDKPVQSTNSRLFDFQEVHPNILNKAPGEGWKAYCLGRDGKEQVRNISNIEGDPFNEAVKLAMNGNADEGFRLLCRKRPREIALHGRSVRANLMDLGGSRHARVVYAGPQRTIPIWTNKSLWVIGYPGTGKTQWAHYVMRHLTDDNYIYCKGTLAALKHLNPNIHKGVIFDDITIPQEWSVTDYNTLVDYESDGYIKARYADIYMPPQLYKIFLSNHDTLDLAKHASVERRYEKFYWEDGNLVK